MTIYKKASQLSRTSTSLCVSLINGTRKYIIDIAGKLPTILLVIDPCDSSLKKSYVCANSQPLIQYDGGPKDPGAAIYFYLHDRLGSVRQVIDADGIVVNTYTYDPFGKDHATEIDESIDNPFKFTGQFYDDEISQYYLRARQYDPQLMRFISIDPVFGKQKQPLTLHRYLYCTNDSVNRIDPSGEFALAFAIRLLVGATAGALNAGMASGWDGRAILIGAAIGTISSILPQGMGGAIMGVGLGMLNNAQATAFNSKYEDKGLAASWGGFSSGAGFTVAAGMMGRSMLSGGLGSFVGISIIGTGTSSFLDLFFDWYDAYADSERK